MNLDRQTILGLFLSIRMSCVICTPAPLSNSYSLTGYQFFIWLIVYESRTFSIDLRYRKCSVKNMFHCLVATNYNNNRKKKKSLPDINDGHRNSNLKWRQNTFIFASDKKKTNNTFTRWKYTPRKKEKSSDWSWFSVRFISERIKWVVI